MGETNLRPVDYAPVSKIPKQATLLGLPYELRNQIYNYLLPCGENITIRAVPQPSVQSPIIDLSSPSRSNITTGQVFELDTREFGNSYEPYLGRQFEAVQRYDRPTKLTNTFASLYPRNQFYIYRSYLWNVHILRTCRQINEETTHLLYGKNRIHLACVNGRLGIVVRFLSLMRLTTRQSIRKLGIRSIHPKAFEAGVLNNPLSEERLLWNEYHLEMASTFFKIIDGMNLVELLIHFDIIPTFSNMMFSEVYGLNTPWLEPFLSRFEPSKLLIEVIFNWSLINKAERARSEALMDMLYFNGYNAIASYYSSVRHTNCGRSKLACECYDAPQCIGCVANGDRCKHTIKYKACQCNHEGRLIESDYFRVRFDDGIMYCEECDEK